MSWSFFGGRAEREIVEPPREAPQAQTYANNQIEASLTDKEKWQRSKQRWNPNIKPAHDAFSVRYNHFVEELKTKSPEAVVKHDFSTHEVRKFLNGYVDKKRFRAIHVQQTIEKHHYKALLESDDYKDIQAHASPLALKLTMMYFGLPVAPMAFTDPLQTSGSNPFENLVFATGMDEDEDEFEDQDFSFVPEELRPLRFLNYYDVRSHGEDNAHMNPDKTYELFYGIPMVVPTHELMSRMRLRGAGVADAPGSQHSGIDDDSDESFPMVTYEIPELAKINSISPHLEVRGGQGGASAGEQVYLWGLSGRTVFSYFDAKSFFSAIDRILGLRKRSDDVNSVGITVSLLSHPKGKRGPCLVLASDQCFLGRSEEVELNFYRTWLDTVQYFDDQIEDGNALDICVAFISQDVHFSGMQKDLAYRPSLEDDSVVSFSLSDDKDGTLSYLSMNQSINRETSAIHYQELFKSLWRTLSCPTKEQLKTYTIGSNEVLPPQPCLVSITCADKNTDEGHHWFFSDVGPTNEAWDCFIDAYVKGRREFVLDAIPVTDPRASSISVPVEIASVANGEDHSVQNVHERDPQSYWGCHSHTDDAIAFQETDRPQQQPAREQPPQLNPLGRPVNGVQLDDFAKGKAFREWSYAHPLSIHMQGQHPSIPINAPPLETILKTPGIHGRPSDSVPVISTQVLTPTEQRHLQETVFEMRNLALNRAQPCPFVPCRKHFAIDDAGRQHFRDHIQDTHIDKKCPLCDDRMFGYYDERTKQQHFYEKHVHYFSHKDDLHLNTVFKVVSNESTHERETKWNFCARCGRDHNQLNVNGDRAQHDNTCFPGVTQEEARRRYCVDCGESTSGTAKHICTLDPTADPIPVHCQKCALPTHKLARSYAEKHLARCRGSNNNKAHWCPWCGQDLIIYSRTQSHKHLDECKYKPPSGEGPINTTTGEANESPKDDRQTRYWAKQFRFTRGGTQNIIQVPTRCLVIGCTKMSLQELNADALLDHYSTETHASATDSLRLCPICSLDFVQREWVEKQQKVNHFKDHIEEREQRIHLDLEIARATNKLDKVVSEKIKLRDEDEFSSKTSQNTQHQAEGQDFSSKLEKIERLLEDQKREKKVVEETATLERERLGLLESNFKTLLDTFQDAFAHDRPAKRLREITSTVDTSSEASFKRQKAAKIPETVDPHTPQNSRGSQVNTLSTGSSGAIMSPSDDIGPAEYRGSETSSPISSRTRGPLVSPQSHYPTRSAIRTQGGDTTEVRTKSQQLATESSPATAPINLGPKQAKSRVLVKSGTSAMRTRARRAQVARAGRDEQVVAEADDNDEEECEVEEQ